MDIDEMKSAWQNQEPDSILASVNNEHLFQKVKFRMHKFEKFVYFAVTFYLTATLGMLSANIALGIINSGSVGISPEVVLNLIPSFIAIGVIYYYLKRKNNNDVVGFIKTALIKIKAVIIVFIFYSLYVTTDILINRKELISIASTNSTILSLTIILHILIIGYIIYLYFTLIKPVYSGFKDLKKSISNL